MRKGFVIVLFLLAPSFASAEELVPAICRQVLDPQAGMSLTEIVKEHVMASLKTAPEAFALSAKELVDDGAQALASAVEARKPSASGGVLGASDAYHPTLLQSFEDKFLAALAFVIRHWLWALGAVTILIIGYSFRP